MLDYMNLSVNLPREEAEALRRLAADRRTTVTEVVRDAITTECFFDQLRKNNAEILVRLPNGNMEVVYFRRYV